MTISPAQSFLCKIFADSDLCFSGSGFGPVHKYHFSRGSFCKRNLSNLNLGGEISPAIGDLKSIQYMYVYFRFTFAPEFYFITKS